MGRRYHERQNGRNIFQFFKCLEGHLEEEGNDEIYIAEQPNDFGSSSYRGFSARPELDFEDHADCFRNGKILLGVCTGQKGLLRIMCSALGYVRDHRRYGKFGEKCYMQVKKW